MKKESVTYLLREIIKKVHANANKQLKKYDLTFPQYQALMLLLYDETLSMSKVKKELLISQSGATTLIDKLVKKELIKRYYSSKDRRRVMISGTKRGKEVLERLFAGHEEFMSDMSRKIGEKDIKIVTKALKILLVFLNTYVTK